MSFKLRIVLILLVFLADIFSFHQIRRGKMSLNHSLLWIFISLLLLVIALFPGVAFWLAGLMGIETPVNMVFLSFAFFSIALFIYLTNVVSREDRINRRLTQKVALLEKRIGQLEAAAAPGHEAESEGKADGKSEGRADGDE